MNNKLEFNKSVLIVAHPDDEILWFSSILNNVKKIIFVFKGTSNKTVEQGRNKILDTETLPYADKIINLNIDEADVLNATNWKMPKQTFYGIKTKSKKYEENFHLIKKKLQNELKKKEGGGLENVITHNPWGEYGHEDHIQVFRVITDLMRKGNFSVWVSKYFSEKTIPLMYQCQNYSSENFTNKYINKDFCNKIEKIYKSYGAWTWSNHYQWPKKEGFYKIKKNMKLFKFDKINIPHTYDEMNFIMMFDKQFTYFSKFRSNIIQICQKIFPNFFFNLIIHFYKKKNK
jgi:hypothetical protein